MYKRYLKKKVIDLRQKDCGNNCSQIKKLDNDSENIEEVETINLLGAGVRGENTEANNDNESESEEAEDSTSNLETSSIDKAWDEIYEQCTDESSVNPISNSFGKTVRLFVSSTFADFFNEREVLVKKVFPELREWLENRHMYLVECDLRWGIPSYATSAETIETCMEEIDRCIVENEQPFFLNLTGNRYGWVPGIEDVPQNLHDRYSWVDNTSITCMEILHGAFRKKNPNALFMLRDLDGIIPAKHQKSYLDQNRLNNKRQRAELKERFPHQILEYKCSVDGLRSICGKERVALTDLDDFTEKVSQFFRKAINSKYPEQSMSQVNSYIQGNIVHLEYMHQRSENFYGRQEELKAIDKFIDDNIDEKIIPSNNDQELTIAAKNWGLSLELCSPILCVFSPPGHGKTSLVAKLIMSRVKDMTTPTFFHFCGLNKDQCILLARLFAFLSCCDKDYGLEESEEEKQNFASEYEKLLEKSEDDLIILLKNKLKTFTKKVIIIIDAVNEVLNNKSSQHLSWLPPAFHSNIKCVVSCSEEDLPSKSRLLSKFVRPLIIGQFSMAAREEMVDKFFKKYSKKLDDEQMKLLLGRVGSISPQWLQTACEELRVLGDYSQVTNRIKIFDNHMDGLLSQILLRISEDDESRAYNFKKVLLLVMLSGEHGVSEQDILNLLGDFKNNEPINQAEWGYIRRSLTSFIKLYPLQPANINFVHATINKVVRDHYNVHNPKQEKKFHCILADYYEYYCKRTNAVLQRIPYHLMRAGYRKRLIAFLDDKLNKVKIPLFKQRLYKQALRCQQVIIPNMTCPAIICKMCGVHITTENTVCFICGSTYAPQCLRPAMLCVQHKPPVPQRNECIKCEKITPTDMIKCEARICIFCNTGHLANRCCKLLTRD